MLYGLLAVAFRYFIHALEVQVARSLRHFVQSRRASAFQPKVDRDRNSLRGDSAFKCAGPINRHAFFERLILGAGINGNRIITRRQRLKAERAVVATGSGISSRHVAFELDSEGYRLL